MISHPAREPVPMEEKSIRAVPFNPEGLRVYSSMPEGDTIVIAVGAHYNAPCQSRGTTAHGRVNDRSFQLRESQFRVGLGNGIRNHWQLVSGGR